MGLFVARKIIYDLKGNIDDIYSLHDKLEKDPDNLVYQHDLQCKLTDTYNNLNEYWNNFKYPRANNAMEVEG